MKKSYILPAVVVCLISTAHGERAQEADVFVDSAGVNTHLSYTNTAYYKQWPQILEALEKSHIRHVRDGYYPWPATAVLYPRHQQLKAAGIDCDYVTQTTPTPEAVALFQALAGDMAYLEAPNEMDDQKGAGWATTLQSSLPGLYTTGASTRVPVIGPSLVFQKSYPLLGDLAPAMDYNNLHVYFGGRNPGSHGWGSVDAEGNAYGSIPWWLDNAQVDGPGKPSIVTETGYLSNPVATPYTLPQNIEARYATRTLLEMFNAGVVKTYFYELIDEVSSPGYGLMDVNLKPKLAYTALESLLNLLQDRGRTFQPGVLNYSLSGASPTVHHLLLQKRNHSFYLLLWIEASGYNPATNTVTPVPVQNVQLALTGASAIRVDQLTDRGSISSYKVANLATLPIALTDDVTIVQITGN